MVGGQVEDLAWESDPTIENPLAVNQPRTLDALEHIHQHKTGALFRACLKLGVHSAQGDRPDPTLLDRLETYGRCFGLVFQITDDLIDVEGKRRRHRQAGRQRRCARQADLSGFARRRRQPAAGA